MWPLIAVAGRAITKRYIDQLAQCWQILYTRVAEQLRSFGFEPAAEVH